MGYPLKIQYLYILEDGTLLLEEVPPTKEEIINIEDGILEVLKITGKVVGIDGHGKEYELNYG